jgi:DNA-binding transcriptional ArsR family regulator
MNISIIKKIADNKENLDNCWLFGYIAKCATIKESDLDEKTKARYEVRAQIIRAMAHPTRLYIVDMLASGKMCVRDLTKEIGADMSTVSKHLTILKNAGIVQDKKNGSQIFYNLKMPCVLNFFKCVEMVVSTNARERLDLITIKPRKK